ncbi:hypothetical protein BD410DRAFT_902910 [Rickenella mellea]|uniref:Uncharacterized protein n=1 Tax=Rickenella mellea TaxID=50990 RepID=A0A4Y7PHB8_9AGAM|nr:hypothetical protein BD410DRAFT_902910 [Rickenella mellea]
MAVKRRVRYKIAGLAATPHIQTMFTSLRITFVLPVLAMAFGVCSAQFTVFGEDSGPSFSLLGSGTNNETIQLVATESGVTETATVILGPTGESFVFPTASSGLVRGDCGFGNGFGLCTIVVMDKSETFTTTASMTDSDLATTTSGTTVDGGTTAGPSSTVSAASISTSISSGSSSDLSTPSPTSGGSSTSPKSAALSTRVGHGIVLVVFLAVSSGIQIL